jgi:hypothetical protein
VSEPSNWFHGQEGIQEEREFDLLEAQVSALGWLVGWLVGLSVRWLVAAKKLLQLIDALF